MKGFWLVMMLAALLVTAWLMTRQASEQVSGSGAPAALKTMERAEQARKTVEAAQKAAEGRLNGAAKE